MKGLNEDSEISVLGLGLIGGSLAKAIRNTSPEIKISAFDKPEILSLAINDGVIDTGLDNFLSASQSDIIFLCFPSDQSYKALKELAPLVKPGSIITDVCGVKGRMDSLWKTLESRAYYIGGHPMAGKEKGGYVNSEAHLFENAVYILSDSSKELPAAGKLVELLSSIGARVKFLDPYLHDKIVANVSHLPQLLAVLLVNVAASPAEGSGYLDFAGRGFHDMTRIAESDYSVWESILTMNREELITAIERLQVQLTSLEEMIQCSEHEKIQKLFESAKVHRDRIPKNVKGFLNPLHDLFVNVTDRPGVFYNITGVLYNNNIDIKDMEVLKIREDGKGIVRLSFLTERELELAKEALQQEGYVCR